MSKKTILLSVLLLLGVVTFAQDGISYGGNVGFQINSAILPDLELNRNLTLTSLLNGDDVVKGTPQLADFKLNYKLGGFLKYDDGFGFTMLEANYTPTKIYKEFKLNTGTDLFPVFTLTKLDIKYAYLDIALSYNIYLYKDLFFSLGGSPSFLLSNSGSVDPEKMDIRIFSGFGYKLKNNMSISARVELGTSEVYKDSYFHHIMIPVSVSIPF
jgi:hypothetical protein